MKRPVILWGAAVALSVATAGPLSRAEEDPRAWAVATAALHDLAQNEDADAKRERWELVEMSFPVAGDWARQDFGADPAAWLGSTGFPEIVRRAAARAREELGRPAAVGPAGDLAAVLADYVTVASTRRARRLATVVALAPDLVFTRHYNLGGSHYAYTEGQSDAQAERHFVPGAALVRLRVGLGGHVRVEPLLEDPGGVIRDPDVSYDGRRILFAWKKSDLGDDYHLYEMDAATRRVRTLTAGLGVADYEGAYLPDGRIIFNSTRCVQTVDCWWTEVSNLYACDGDGGRIRRLTFDQVHDNYPTVTEDLRILYTRWEYNDRGQVYPQPLLQMNPDGTGQTEFYGVNSWFPTTILHARGIPGTKKVLAIATGHHSRQAGKLIVIDPARGRQEADGVQLVAPVRPTVAEKIDAYGQEGELFQYPYPLTRDEFLCAHHPVGWVDGRKGEGQSLRPRFRVCWMALDGRREVLAADPGISCNQPVPLRPRSAPPRRPSAVDEAQTEATVHIQDVHAGPGLIGIERGRVRTVRVVSLDFRAAGIGSNYSRGPGGGALASTPVSIGNGCWDPKIVLGDADVRPDGSAFFRVPARRPVYFQLLDATGRMVQTMRSWTTLQPGEHASCAGCHESKNSAPPAAARVTRALREGPQALRPFQGPERGFSFAREIQPILDRHCAACHRAGGAAPFGLTAAVVEDAKAKRRWSEAYLALTHARNDQREAWQGDADHAVVNWVSAQSAPPLQPPYAAGAARSRLTAMLEQSHGKTALSREEQERIAAWIDLGVPFCGDYTEANAWTEQERDLYRRFLDKRLRVAAEDAGAAPAPALTTR